MAVHKGALDAFDSGVASNRKSSDGMSIFVHGLTADLRSVEKRYPILNRVVQIAIAPVAEGRRRTNDRDRCRNYLRFFCYQRSERMRGAGFEPANPYGTG